MTFAPADGTSIAMKMNCRRRIEVKADALQDRLARKNMGLADLSREISSSIGYLSKIVNGRTQPGPNIRRRIAAALDCQFDDLFLIESGQNVPQNRPIIGPRINDLPAKATLARPGGDNAA